MTALSLRVQSLSKMRSKPSQHLFWIIDLAKWAPRISKYEFVKKLSRMNEAAGVIVSSLNSAQSILGSNPRCLFGPGRT